MSELNSLLKSIPVEQIAAQLGIDPAQASEAIQNLLPSLVGGMQANAQDPQGAASLENALSQHAGNTSLLDNPNVADIDTEDGAKIAHHIFGSNEGAVAEKVAAKSGTDTSLIQKLLPIIAPIAMAWLASRLFGQKDTPAAEPVQRQSEPVERQVEPAETNRGAEAPIFPGQTGNDQAVGQGGLGDLLGGILGGGSGSSQGGGGLGDLLGSLGGLLGGGRR
ncbi:DUF937 domain-containing protein [Gulosibacter macacae]|uniref:DUF937 domain-containing protein n=1 Tax=Gulosibacter macacae TaxID=2488791 RepID=A0A3P3VWW1_9MICO|nr:DUF937 domain-containing protein [Gulosibacter macacae]RRJ86934.1 DUF937 domain-containing protein [Gulosibacter macacae]